MSKEDFARSRYYKMKGYKKKSDSTKQFNNYCTSIWKGDAYCINAYLKNKKTNDYLDRVYQCDFDVNSKITRKAFVK